MRMCGAVANESATQKLYTPLYHEHLVETDKLLNRQKISNSVKRKAEEDLSRPSKLIHVEVATVPDSIDTLTSYDVSCIRNNLGRNRRAKLPALPKSTEDIQKYLMDTIIKTTKNEDFLLVNDPQSKIVPDQTLNLCAVIASFIWMGHFNSARSIFTNFSRYMYIQMVITYLFCSACWDLGYTCNIEEAVIDFEIAISNAIKEVFPAVKITGCRFHLAQAWFRKIQQLCLTTEYRNKTSAIGQWLRYTFGLTFLSAEEVGNVFSFILMEEKPQDQRVDSFADYLVETYIDEGATYPPIVWAAKTADLSRTTNSCESFHSRIGKYIATPHPNIFTFVESLNGAQTDTYIRKNFAKCNEKVVKRKEVFPNLLGTP